MYIPKNGQSQPLQEFV